MKTLDKYIVRSFLFNTLVWLAIALSMRTVIDLFVNMDEFAELGLDFGNTLAHVAEYYAYQLLAYFADLGGIILIAGAAFTLAKMNHTNELTAMLASGVSLYRVVWPIVLCAMAYCGLIMLDREVLIPPVASRLVRSHDEAVRPEEFRVPLMRDQFHSVWYSPSYDPAEKRMDLPIVVFRAEREDRLVKTGEVRGRWGSPGFLDDQVGWTLIGADGIPVELRPSGEADPDWPAIPMDDRIVTSVGADELRQRIEDVSLDAVQVSIPTEEYDGMRIEGYFRPATGELITPRFLFTADGRRPVTFVADRAVYVEQGGGSHWLLTDGRAFVPSDLTHEELLLRRSSRWMSYLSTRELSRLAALKRVPNPDTVRKLIQNRITDPINNLVMLLVGLPFILSRERNIKASAGLCLLMVGTFYVFVQACRMADLPPVWSAWLPLLVFGPITVVMIDSVKT